MRALRVAANALGAQHAAVEGELFPRLEADDLVALHLELDAALLAAEATVRLHQPVGIDRRVDALAGRVRPVRPERRQEFWRQRRFSGHAVFPPGRPSR